MQGGPRYTGPPSHHLLRLLIPTSPTAARDAFREAIARADGVPARERADLYTNLGCALVELDAFAEALDAFRSAVEADPSHQNAAKNVLAMRSFLASSAA